MGNEKDNKTKGRRSRGMAVRSKSRRHAVATGRDKPVQSGRAPKTIAARTTSAKTTVGKSSAAGSAKLPKIVKAPARVSSNRSAPGVKAASTVASPTKRTKSAAVRSARAPKTSVRKAATTSRIATAPAKSRPVATRPTVRTAVRQPSRDGAVKRPPTAKAGDRGARATATPGKPSSRKASTRALKPRSALPTARVASPTQTAARKAANKPSPARAKVAARSPTGKMPTTKLMDRSHSGTKRRHKSAADMTSTILDPGLQHRASDAAGQGSGDEQT